MKRQYVYVFGVLFMIFLIGGCRSGRYDITKSQLKTDLQGSGKVAIGVQDQRPFILDGIKQPSFIGIHRHGFGIPKDIETRSGRTLAEDVATIVASSFSATAFEVTQFPLSPQDNLESSLNRLAPSAYDKIIVFTLDQFRSDSWAEVELQWAITMRVYDGKGKLLAEKDSTGTVEGLKRNYTGSITGGQAQKAIATQLTTILAELINAPECQRAILYPDLSLAGGMSYKDAVFPKPVQWREQQAASTSGIPTPS